MKGIVKKIKKIKNGAFYTISTGEKELSVFSTEAFFHGDIVEIKEGNIYRSAEDITKEFEERIKKRVGYAFNYIPEEMKAVVFSVAQKLLYAQESGRALTVRYHNDADGICAALALSKTLSFKSTAQKGVFYTLKDAVKDFENMGQMHKPLIALLDFGSSEESREGLCFLESVGIEHLIIDHHPPAHPSINPWFFGSTSMITTTMICADIAKALGKDCKDLVEISAAADKSDKVEVGEEAKKKALVLDFLALHGTSNIEFYKAVLEDKNWVESIWEEAHEKLSNEAKNVKIKEKGGVGIYYIEQQPRTWPPPGKITTHLFEERGDVLGVGVIDNLLIMRSRKEVVLDIIERLKKKGLALRGGGHKKAGSVKVNEGMVEVALEEIIYSLSILGAK